MIDLHLLGVVDLRGPHGREHRSVLAQPKRFALLSYLAAASPRGFHRRDTLFALFWPELDETHARRALRQAVHFLRQSLGTGVLVNRGDEEIGVDERELRCDVAELRAALDAGELVRGLELYRGDLLEGFHVSDAAPEFEAWLIQERERLRDRTRDAAWWLAEAAEAAGDARGAAHWGRRAAGLVPCDEGLLGRLVSLLDRLGDRAGAIRAYRDFEQRLANIYEIDPSPETKALIEGVCAREEAIASPTLPSAIAGSRESREALTPASRSSPSSLSVASGAEPATPTRMDGGSTERSDPPVSRNGRGVRHRRMIAALVAIATIIVAGARVLGGGDPSVPDGSVRTVVVGAIQGTDASLALAVREALRVELESTPQIRVLGEASIRETLQLMLLPPDTALSTPVTRAIALRRGIPLVISGSVTPLGTGAQLVVRLHEAATGTVLASLSERPETDEEIIPAVSRLAGAVRSRVTGTPADSLPPLPAVSTSSLPALRNYALARQALEKLDRHAAIRLGEAALVHDSMFALAHYLVADQLWYVDQQRHSDEHMRRAYELGARLPPRERLTVRARFEQLIRDRPDSALVYWQLLAESYPDEALAYEGMRWVHRALGETSLMAAASAKAFARDPTWLPHYVQDQIDALMMVEGDTAAAFAFARSFVDRDPRAERRAHYLRAVLREDWNAALRLSDDHAATRHFVLVAAGRLDEAAGELDAVRPMDLQHAPRALLLQARAELAAGRPAENARALTQEALEWVVAADLSPPAYARLAERIADTAARMGDEGTVAATRRLILAKDQGRSLRSYDYALLMIDACAAFARGDMERAADLAGRARSAMFYGRSVATIILLEADARTALGRRERADSLYREVLTPNSFVDGDPETLAVMRGFARQALASSLRTQELPPRGVHGRARPRS